MPLRPATASRGSAAGPVVVQGLDQRNVGLQLRGQAADTAVELTLLLGPGAGELVQAASGMGVNEQKRCVFLLQELEHPHQHVGVIAA
jgi:hypothetical protein